MSFTSFAPGTAGSMIFRRVSALATSESGCASIRPSSVGTTCMSSPEARAPEAELAERSAGLYDLVNAVLAAGVAEQVPDQTVQELLTMAVRLYSAKCDGEEP